MLILFSVINSLETNSIRIFADGYLVARLVVGLGRSPQPACSATEGASHVANVGTVSVVNIQQDGRSKAGPLGDAPNLVDESRVADGTPSEDPQA
jgi:hypothetical protein